LERIRNVKGAWVISARRRRADFRAIDPRFKPISDTFKPQADATPAAPIRRHAKSAAVKPEPVLQVEVIVRLGETLQLPIARHANLLPRRDIELRLGKIRIRSSFMSSKVFERPIAIERLRAVLYRHRIDIDRLCVRRNIRSSEERE